MVRRNDWILAYRIGTYRDDRDAFANRKSIGLPCTLSFDDISLFSSGSFGVEECAISVLAQHLDLSYSAFQDQDSSVLKIDSVMIVDNADATLDVVIVLVWDCPEWFEPISNRLSLNDPYWLCTSMSYGDSTEFEPWSAKILSDWSVQNK